MLRFFLNSFLFPRRAFVYVSATENSFYSTSIYLALLQVSSFLVLPFSESIREKAVNAFVIATFIAIVMMFMLVYLSSSVANWFGGSASSNDVKLTLATASIPLSVFLLPTLSLLFFTLDGSVLFIATLVEIGILFWSLIGFVILFSDINDFAIPVSVIVLLISIGIPIDALFLAMNFASDSISGSSPSIRLEGSYVFLLVVTLAPLWKVLDKFEPARRLKWKFFMSSRILFVFTEHTKKKWIVWRGGESRPLSIFNEKSSAIYFAQEAGRKGSLKVKVFDEYQRTQRSI